MSKELFEKLANDYCVDTYGNMFADGGWGVSFAMDIAQGLHQYLSDNHNGQWSEEYQAYSAMKNAPIFYKPGYFYFDPEDKDDADNFMARSIYEDCQAFGKWKEFHTALTWFCEQEKE